MAAFGLTSFDGIPADFDQTLANIVKAHPAPNPQGRSGHGDKVNPSLGPK
jgi:hypothetical protein